MLHPLESLDVGLVLQPARLLGANPRPPAPGNPLKTRASDLAFPLRGTEPSRRGPHR